jgi:hypothetical protein
MKQLSVLLILSYLLTTSLIAQDFTISEKQSIKIVKSIKEIRLNKDLVEIDSYPTYDFPYYRLMISYWDKEDKQYIATFLRFDVNAYTGALFWFDNLTNTQRTIEEWRESKNK